MNTTELATAIRKMCNDGTIRTHSESCWQWHLPCAALYAVNVIEDLAGTLEMIANAPPRRDRSYCSDVAANALDRYMQES